MKQYKSTQYDLDLFFSWRYFIFHLATAGQNIHDNICFNPSHNNFRAFIKNRNINFEYKINPNLDDILSIKFEAQGIKVKEFNREKYLYDFVSYAKKGIFSFDRTFITNPSDTKYHLVAYPIITENYKYFIEEFFPLYDNYFVPEFFEIDELVRIHFDRPLNIFNPAQ